MEYRDNSFSRMLTALLCSYFGCNRDPSAQEGYYAKIESLLANDMHLDGATKKKLQQQGMSMMPMEFAEGGFIRQVYLSGDEKLIALFARLLPEPRVEFFAAGQAPEKILIKAADADQAITSGGEKSLTEIEAAAEFIKKLQRAYRVKSRFRENTYRLAVIYEHAYKAIVNSMVFAVNLTDEDVKELIVISNLVATCSYRDQSLRFQKLASEITARKAKDILTHDTLENLKAILGEIYTAESIHELISLPLNQLLSEQYIREILCFSGRLDIVYSKIVDETFSRVLQVDATMLLSDADKVYLPKMCSKALSRGIVRILFGHKSFELFDTIRHVTSIYALHSIFDAGLMGRRTLLQFLQEFTPAALGPGDITMGDCNVVCCSAFDIDPAAGYDRIVTELILDSAQIIASNSNGMFFKQRDLGLERETAYDITLDNTLKISIDYKREDIFFILEITLSKLYSPDEDVAAKVALPVSLFVSNNMHNIHQILVLNFFRLLDKLFLSKIAKEHLVGFNIYATLESLIAVDGNSNKLEQALREIGLQFSRFMEFNFIGFHQINFTSLKCIKLYDVSGDLVYELIIDELIAAINTGSAEDLQEAQKKLPGAFASYRFIDYLITKATNTVARSDLQSIRDRCNVPSWHKACAGIFQPPAKASSAASKPNCGLAL